MAVILDPQVIEGTPKEEYGRYRACGTQQEGFGAKISRSFFSSHVNRVIRVVSPSGVFGCLVSASIS